MEVGVERLQNLVDKRPWVLILVNLLFFVSAGAFTVFFRTPSLGGVTLIIATVVVSFFLTGKKGLVVGLVNIGLASSLMILYYSTVEEPLEFVHVFSTSPTFIIGGYFAGKFNELKTRYSKRLEKEVEERTQELEEAKKKLEDSEKILKVRVKAKTRELRELNETLEERVEERTKELERKKERLREKRDELREKVNELEKLHQLTVGREMKMV